MRYAVVSFDDTDETDFLPLTWITDRTALLDVSSLVVSKSIVTFYWPPWRNGTRLSQAKSAWSRKLDGQFMHAASCPLLVIS